MPIKELKNGARISELCHESKEPIHVTKNGFADMVIMSAEVYDALAESARLNDTANAIREGIESIERGECHDAFEAVSNLRELYGI